MSYLILFFNIMQLKCRNIRLMSIPASDVNKSFKFGAVEEAINNSENITHLQPTTMIPKRVERPPLVSYNFSNPLINAP